MPYTLDSAKRVNKEGEITHGNMTSLNIEWKQTNQCTFKHRMHSQIWPQRLHCSARNIRSSNHPKWKCYKMEKSWDHHHKTPHQTRNLNTKWQQIHLHRWSVFISSTTHNPWQCSLAQIVFWSLNFNEKKKKSTESEIEKRYKKRCP